MAEEVFVRISPGNNPGLAVGIDDNANVILQVYATDRSDQVWRLKQNEGLAGTFIIHHITNRALSWLELGSQVVNLFSNICITATLLSGN